MCSTPALLLLAVSCSSCLGNILLVEDPNLLTPPYFNIATGKKIKASATCGESGPQRFCKLTGGPNENRFAETLQEGAYCDFCDDTVPSKSHPIRYAIDGTEKWWQSPPLSQGIEYNEINITIHLGQVYHVAYALIKFANSPRAGTWVLERSSDHGKTFHPWQYFASTESDCVHLFGIDPFEGITSDDSAICTSRYSDVVPLEGGEVIVSTVNNRPGSNNFSHSPVLQEWTKATDIRLRLLRTKTLLAHLMAVQQNDPTVTRRYYYSIKDISIGGRCVCHGHANTCVPDKLDRFRLMCECRHNTCGDSCEMCCPGFVQKAWRAAVPESSNECEECNCHGHSTECYYDEEVAARRQSMDKYGNFEGGGVCVNCTHNTIGNNCEKCVDGYYRPADVNATDPYGCRPCECNSSYTVGTCEPVTGRCYCKPQYDGDRCDRCAPGYRNFPECEACPCYYDGTRNGVCEPEEGGTCPCKYNFGGMYCNQCESGFHDFPDCIQCQCPGAGAISEWCDAQTGQCECDLGFDGLACDRCAPGYYNYPSCQGCTCITAFTTSEICNTTDGTCFCTGLATGDSCNQCLPGYFDFPTCIECRCSSEGSLHSLCDGETGRCDCKPNYSGLECNECAPEYYNYPLCVPCNCNVQGSVRTTCDSQSGDCSCSSFITGRQCDQCAPQYFNFPRCEDCKCDPRGIKNFEPGVCLAFTEGQCDCKENVVGMYCDSCDPLHYNLDSGCLDCNCLLQGTLDGVAACNPKNGHCWCKTYADSQRCSACEPGFFGLSEANYFACFGCQCNRGGSLSEDCDPIDGQCPCKPGLEGRRCDKVAAGYFSPTILQYQYELENGQTPGGEVLRFGYNQTVFPGFSEKGYAEFSYAQYEIVVPITVYNQSNGLYHVYIHYMQPQVRNVGVITFDPVTATGSRQTVDVNFDVTIKPTLLSVGDVFVLTPGQWNILIEGKPGLLVDYIVLIPSEYYEASILQAKVIEPCPPVSSGEGKECIIYSHPPLDQYLAIDLNQNSDSDRLTSTIPNHEPLLILDGQSILGYNEYDFIVSPPKVGKYVLVMEYTSDCEHMHTIEAHVSDGRVYDDVKFNVYKCEYAFLCRQVALSSTDEVMVVDISFESAEVRLSVDPQETAYLYRVYAIPYEEWSMEYVEPKRRCIIIEGSDPNECIPWKYPFSETGTIYQLGNDEDSDDRPLESTQNVQAKYIDGNETIRVDMELTPGRYIILLHYFNPEHLSFDPVMTVFGGFAYEGSANVTHCPGVEGCRAVFVTNDGVYMLDITNPSQFVTISVPAGKSFWLDYILAIPEKSYKASFLEFSFYDYSRKFFKDCYGVGTQGLIELADNPSEFCLGAIFTLTTSLNDGAKICECSLNGTVGEEEADCESYGGECPCKPNVIGRTCDECAIGFHGFPDCQPCNCNGLLCDELNGNCICPPNTEEPECKQCTPFTHSYHPLAGCVACDCDRRGVNDSKHLGCSVVTGQCMCKDNVEGLMCDRCRPGFFAFPECRPCVCNTRGSKSDVCDAINGQCNCKENVHGQRCDQCKPGTFHLYGSNPVGCTSCFCFGESTECASTKYPVSEIRTMDGWSLLNTKVENPLVVSESPTIVVDVAEHGGPVDSIRASLYWSAPAEYLGRKLGSYGGTMSYIIQYKSGSLGRGDYNEPPPALLTGIKPHVILQGGGGLNIGWTNPEFKGNPYKVTLKLIEANFIHQTTGNPVTREDMMMTLENLSAILIKATDDPRAVSVRLWDVSFPDTDYNGRPTNVSINPSVESCLCPKGYTGESCEMCDVGFFRDTKGPYLGYCVQCDCFEHCEACNASGNLIQPGDCMHSTAGDRCEVCQDGYIGDPTTGDKDACQICPCPHSTPEGNFADSCSETDDGDLVCNCQPGYAGDRCELCSLGYHGNPEIIGGKCELCDCNGNSLYGYESCDTLTGVCTECEEGYGGKHCEICAEGFYGHAIDAKNCSACSCLQCGTSHCDRNNGKCSCLPNVAGEYCDHCETGYYNFGSCLGCKSCGCGLASLSPACGDSTGQCECAPNVVGLKCDKCAEGHWDYNSNGCKPCECGNINQCNPVTGECECPAGTKGKQCDQCESPRHIIPKGQILCEACGKCTHDLLDTMEDIASYAARAAQAVNSLSAAVFANRKMSKLSPQIEQIMFEMQRTGRAFAALDQFFALGTPVTDIFSVPSIGSGSGMEEIGSGVGEGVGVGMEEFMPFSNQQSFTSMIDTSLGMMENTLTGMCNYTGFLLDKTENTFLTITFINTNMNVSGVAVLYEEALSFLQNLNLEASGDETEFRNFYVDGTMLLDRLKLRSYSDMTTYEREEVSKAENAFLKVNSTYITPAVDLNQNYEECYSLLEEKISKLKEIRILQNQVVANTTKTESVNVENKKKLELVKNAMSGIKETWADALNLLVDSKTLLRTGQDYARSEVIKSDDLVALFGDLQRHQQLAENISQVVNLVNESLAKSDQLELDLTEWIDYKNTSVKADIATQAAVRYSTIIDTVTAASGVASNAKTVAGEILNTIETNDLENSSEEQRAYANLLLSDLQKKTMSVQNYEKAVQASRGGINNALRPMGGFRSQVESFGNRTARLSPIDGHEIMNATKISTEAKILSADVMKRVALLEESIERAPSTDYSMSRVVKATNKSLRVSGRSFAKVTRKLRTLSGRAAGVEALRQSLDIEEKIKNIRKLIDLSRDVAGTATVSMKFKVDGDDVQFVQPRLPASVAAAQDYMKLELYLNVTTRRDNAILYWGNVGSKSGDHIALTTRNGFLNFQFKVGHGRASISSSSPINDNHWHKVVIERIGNSGKLTVQSRNPDSDVLDGDLYITNTTTGKTNSKDMRAILPSSQTVFLVGGIPPKTAHKSLFPNRKMQGCIKGLTVNSERIGLWNFISYGGSTPGENCNRKPMNYPATNRMWKFRGTDSYLRVTHDQLVTAGLDFSPSIRISIMQFKLLTLQSDALLFLVGESRDQFFAVELVGGKFMITCNFGWDQPKSGVAHAFPDVNTETRAVSFKAGVIPFRRNRAVILTHNTQIGITLPFTTWNPNITGHGWVGGVLPEFVPDDLRQELKSVDQNFRGCVGNLAFHFRRQFDVFKAYETYGVSRGCERETILNFQVLGSDFIVIPLNLSDVQRVRGFVTVRTQANNGTIVVAKQMNNDRTVTLRMSEGKILLSDGVSEIQTTDSYNDGEPHTIVFKRNSDCSLHLNVDDVEMQDAEGLCSERAPAEEEEDYEQVRRRRENLKYRESTSKMSLFAMSLVHLYLGGTDSVTAGNFTGCIGNAQIYGDTRHPDLLTSDLRCGTGGNARCFGKPKFNKCNMQPTEIVLPQELARSTSTITEGEELADGLVPAFGFKGEVPPNADRQGERTHTAGIAYPENHRDRGDAVFRNQFLSAPQGLHVSGHDGSCHLPLNPQNTGMYFPGDGYSKYSIVNMDSLDWRFTMYIRTTAKEGIIFFLCGSDCSEHIAVYMAKGKLNLKVKFAGESMRIKTEEKYCDGEWHLVTFQRKRLNMLLRVDDMMFFEEIYEYSRTFTEVLFFYIGGLQPRERDSAADYIHGEYLRDFEGCVRNLVVNDSPVDNADTTYLLYKLNVRTCFDGNTETGIYFSDSSPVEDGSFVIVYDSYNIGKVLEVELEIRPRSESGVLFAIGGETGNFFQLALIDGKVVTRVKQGSDLLMSIYDPSYHGEYICDGNWHKIKVLKSKNMLSLTVDDNLAAPENNGTAIDCVTHGQLFMGGVPIEANVGKLLSSRRQYAGCMRNVVFDFYRITTSIAFEVLPGVSDSCPVG